MSDSYVPAKPLEKCAGQEWTEALEIASQLPFIELHLHLDGRRVLSTGLAHLFLLS